MGKLKHTPKGRPIQPRELILTPNIDNFPFHKPYPSAEPQFTQKDIQDLKWAVERLLPYQKQIINLWLDGYNQSEIARYFKVAQQTINKSIWGVRINGKTRGGIIKKLRKLIQYKKKGIKVPVKNVKDRDGYNKHKKTNKTKRMG